MKKKLFIMPALALALFTACSGDEALVTENNAQQTVQDDAIAFDAYLNRTVTRAGAVGGVDLAKLQTTGFGVFAYYANGDLYSENAIPDFMYNQEVKYSGGWTYSPLKYWPNEFGSSAISTGVDRVTFFAYAPYVGVDPATGQLTSHYTNDPSDPTLSTETGITALTRNGKTGDPYVRYVGAFEPDNCVDLLYGVAAEEFTSSVGAADGANRIKKGDPYVNIAKPEVNSRLKFDFKHALAKLNVQVDADVDIINHNTGDELDDNTRIWIRSITFDGIAERGYLNLNSGMWYDVIDNTKISHASVTVHDGRRDGAEAIADDSYETPIGFNENLIQKAAYSATETPDGTTGVPTYTGFSTTTEGVKATNQNLFSGSNDLLVIPANEQLKVTIVYDVETADPTLPTYLSDGTTKGSTVENKITKSITLGGNALKLEAGNAYTINLHLGMTSVKFEATVSDWTEEGTTDNPWLPENVKVLAAGTTSSYNVPAGGGDFNVKITGLTVSSNKAASGDASPTWTADNPASSGILSFTLTENTSVKEQTKTAILTETGDGATVTTINITQAAHPLGLGVSAFDGSAKTITLSKTASDWGDITDATSVYDTDKRRVQVKKNGIALTGVASSAATGQFTFSSGTITLGDAPVAGDVYTITVKASDNVEAESIIVNVGGSVLSNAAQNIEYGETYTRLPEFIGPATPTYTWTSSETSNATVSSGVVTSVAVGNATITLSTDDIAPADGWVYVTSDKTYDVTVVKATGTISFTDANPTNPAAFTSGNYDADDVIITNVAVLKNSKSTILTSGSIGTVSYSVSDNTNFQIGSDGILKFNGTWTAGDSHEVTVTATVDDTSATDAEYTVKTATYTITVTAAS